jgi:murein DD-endopeptidase MepM/ murein hydrolase activator NlpD
MAVALIAASVPVAGTAAAGAGEAVAGPEPVGFGIASSRVLPKKPLFDGPRPVKLRFRFRAREAVDLRLSVRARSGRTVANWEIPAAQPGARYKRRWRGIDRRGRAVPDGRYEFRVGPIGRRARRAGGFRLRGHVFPVDGRHSPRGPVGEFGSGRNGGRIHEGFDILAGCGTPLVAVRGGKVKRSGYDDRLYGHFVLIGGRKTKEQYFYSHLIETAKVGTGERVRTGERIGRVGQTGNARSTPCHLHFELRRSGRPIDPEPHLRRWDRWS